MQQIDSGAIIAPSLPLPDPTISYWQDPPSDLSNHRTTSHLPSFTDVLIIGSGITGAFIARDLLSSPSHPAVMMIEARTACSGATGRNGGHTKCASYRSFLGNVDELGEEEAAKIARFEYRCMKAVHAFARKHDINCDSWEGETVDVIYEESQWDKAKKSIMEIRRVLGEEDPAAMYHLWKKEDVEPEFLTPGAFGAVTYQAGSLSAYKFTIGVLKLAINLGLNLQTETPALSISPVEAHGRSQGRWIVSTPRGIVLADKVVLATNGYTARLCPALHGIITPLRGHVTAHRPGSGIPKDGLSRTYSFLYGDGYDYMISRRPGSRFEGDIIIGGGLTAAAEDGLHEYGSTDDTSMDPDTLKYLEDSTEKCFNSNWGMDHPDGRIRKQWSGVMGYSADSRPLIGQMPGKEGLFVAASFQGHGMVLCLLSANALVAMMLGDGDEELSIWFPQSFRVTSERFAPSHGCLEGRNGKKER